jgi:trehalose 6-phosphate phosphatase
MMDCTPQQLADRLIEARRVWLFLDYDGTLAEFAPTPDHVMPDPEVIELVARLAQLETVRVAVISGRRLSQIQALLPVPHVLLAGTYGVEMQLPDGERLERIALDQVRPTLDQIKPRWAHLIAGQPGYFLEDKGWSLALHARFANEAAVNDVLSLACLQALELLTPDRFRLLSGQRFLEIAPLDIDKGVTVNYVIDRFTWPGALPVYIGDDDKDEAAFAVIKARHGLALVVAAQPRRTLADCRLDSPASVRHWLNEIATVFQRRAPITSLDQAQ